MKSVLLILACLVLLTPLAAQDDSTAYDFPQDTTPPLPPLRFHLQVIGAHYLDGRAQYFDGYNATILYASASTGLPLYSDWRLFGAQNTVPDIWQAGLSAGFTDSIRGIRLRIAAQATKRSDTMAYTGGRLDTDTVLGRVGTETATFGGFSVTIMKQSRTLLKFLRLHGGAELEVGLAFRSRIELDEFAYDLGEQRMLSYNSFPARGQPRLHGYLNAVVGLETVFAKHFGFVAEVRSGLGAQIMVREETFGLARTVWMLGLQYYLWDHQRRPLPQRPHIVDQPLEEEAPEGN